MKRRILIFSLESINNVGDEILRVSTEYLINSVSKDYEIKAMQLIPRKVDVCGLYKVDWIVGRFIRTISKYISRKPLSYKIRNISYIVAYKRLFRSQIKIADKIILPIGMLKYSTQDFCYVFHLINKLSTKYHKDVLMSAMSPQEADVNDWRYHLLIKAVNFPAVKKVTTRDGEPGVNIIKRDYLRRDIVCDYVGDPALWIPEAYQVKNDKVKEGAPYVGINIIRKGIFKDYNKASTDDYLKSFYINLIRLLEQKHWRWSVFYNGMLSDRRVLNELQATVNFSNEHIVEDFSDSKKYIEIVSNFDVVFGARLHTCITSVAVGTPVVGFIWEDKLKYFSKSMGIEGFFFDPSEMTAERVITRMEEAMTYKLDISNRNHYKMKTVESIRNFLES